MHPHIAEALAAERIRERQQQAALARQARQARRARRGRVQAVAGPAPSGNHRVPPPLITDPRGVAAGRQQGVAAGRSDGVAEAPLAGAETRLAGADGPLAGAETPLAGADGPLAGAETSLAGADERRPAGTRVA